MKVAIYARYSSENQRDASIADQFRVCREFAQRQGWHIEREYSDQALSGATLLRPGASEIRSTLRDASRGLVPASDSWSKLVGLLYRAVLEPLARNAAYCDAASQVPTVDESQYADPLYSHVVQRHWPGIQDRLRRVFTSDLTETEIVLAEILETLRTLVSELGVIYRRTDQGSCWVEFNEGQSLS